MSTKTVAEKLQIKPGAAVWASDPVRRALLEPLPDRVTAATAPGPAAVAVFFADDAASLRKLLTEHQAELTRPGTVWIAYPKANRADINRDSMLPIVAEFGLRANGQVALDDVWSALRFRPLTEGEEPFLGGRA